VSVICEICGKELKRRQKRFCSHRCYSIWNSGENNPAKRPEVRQKLKEARKKYLVENYPSKRFEIKRKISEKMKRRMKDKKIREMLSKIAKERWRNYKLREGYSEMAKKRWQRPEIKVKILGKNNPNWKGGISTEPYCSIFKMPLKERIREKYGRRCFLCGVKENGRKLSVHHIDYNKKHCTPDNLIPLCVSCNSKVNFNREFWQNYFSSSLILREGFA